MNILPGATIGIIGGGQLGKMLAEAGNKMGYRICVLDPSPEAPAFSAAHDHIVAPFDDPSGFETLVSRCDVVTYEFENIDSNLVKQFNEKTHKIPQGHLPLYIAQNRRREKEALTHANLPVAPYVILTDIEAEIQTAVDTLGYPFVVKTQEGGYDGKGQVVVKSEADLPNLTILYGIPSVAEQFIRYDFEASIIGTRSTSGEFKTFPVAKNLHINNILHQSIADYDLIDKAQQATMHTMLKTFMEAHDMKGTLAMEVFIAGDKIYVNELAPRPHNSGHYTIEGCYTSQFEQHMRAICGLPLGDTSLETTTVMYNILGQHRDALFKYLPNLHPNAHLHLYGKKEYKENRKMGHITFTLDAFDPEILAEFEQQFFNL
ncbi:5-(carboxyamino)imidazole ribonucleotide synthase [Ignatzschineria sp. RMDPL8A]|uniref:5-(carboxyamino)imidazole ribonucleotide synthase n=1 Tax=Ignatzschineria sp. RMDPL8A TaxID=2999236 RepID=UPI0016B8165B|nr:5-(carboxyamino)imidazole ribonucleotide synthase [Ignatzschineria sp. RMDPL8A]MDG9730279.1 5-(carboxyamino)imidazole ribonucleotide synthase [Ignatzschineria sp. RMDPL8A]NLD08479.1 5-(carboxyamino)imidazole ribonucleotide synthase [Xanthomonadaceae bacterium]